MKYFYTTKRIANDKKEYPKYCQACGTTGILRCFLEEC